MITGRVSSEKEAVVRLTVLGSRGQKQEIEAIVDTGFNGSFTLPPDLIEALELPLHSQGQGILADGSRMLFDVFEGAVLWNEQPRRMSVYAADTTPLLGMDLLYGHQLSIDVLEEGTVSIRSLPVS